MSTEVKELETGYPPEFIASRWPNFADGSKPLTRTFYVSKGDQEMAKDYTPEDKEDGEANCTLEAVASGHGIEFSYDYDADQVMFRGGFPSEAAREFLEELPEIITLADLVEAGAGVIDARMESRNKAPYEKGFDPANPFPDSSWTTEDFWPYRTTEAYEPLVKALRKLFTKENLR